MMAVYGLRSSGAKAPGGWFFVEFARKWFDANLSGNDLAMVRSVFANIWADGYSYPPEIYGKRIGLTVKESHEMASRLFSQMLAAYRPTPEAAAVREKLRRERPPRRIS